MFHLAIAGTGAMARYHVKKFSGIRDCTISAVKDHVASHAEAFAREFSIPHWHDNLSQLIQEQTAEALSVAVVDWRHAELCSEALKADLPVFCEKPMTRTLAEARLLATLSQEKQVPTYVNFSKRGAPALHALKSVLSQGLLGNLESVSTSYRQGWVVTGEWGDWRVEPRWAWRVHPSFSTSGVVGDLGSHMVDALLFLFSDLSVDACTRAVDMREVVQSGLITAPGEFLKGNRVWLDIVSQCTVQGKIPCRLHLSLIDCEAVDDVTITVTGSEGTASLDLRRSRTSIELREERTGIVRQVRGPAILSTYEHFFHLASGKESEFDSPVPDFTHGLRVQTILDTLAPGGLPL
ncbi:MAG: Gfo/Idh/MocA family oxidoreductase [Sphaerochaetaceae bacterium]|nr:Gfo/Idh/MocA family oxidoreductase [Sphaerochaetaceae bacterium]